MVMECPDNLIYNVFKHFRIESLILFRMSSLSQYTLILLLFKSIFIELLQTTQRGTIKKSKSEISIDEK